MVGAGGPITQGGPGPVDKVPVQESLKGQVMAFLRPLRAMGSDSSQVQEGGGLGQGCGSVLECLPIRHEALGSSPSTQKNF